MNHCDSSWLQSGTTLPGTTRSRPSAPSPRCRSHRYCTASGDGSVIPCRSSSSTKSLPVPCPFANDQLCLGSVSHGGSPPGPQDALAERVDQVGVACVQPVDAVVPAVPTVLFAREPPGGADGTASGLGLVELTGQVLQDLSVAQRLAGGPGVPQSAGGQPPHLVEETALPHLVDPERDALVEPVAWCVQAELHHPRQCMGV